MPKSDTSVASLKSFLDDISRDDLAMSWLSSPEKRFQQLGRTLLDPRYRNANIVSLCRKYRIALTDLLDNWRSYHHGKATFAMMPHLEQVYEDTAIDAKSRNRLCLECRGTGRIYETVEGSTTRVLVQCVTCEGTGHIRVIGDKDSRKLVFEVMNDINRPSSTEINVGSKNVQHNVVFENFREAISRTNRVLEINAPSPVTLNPVESLIRIDESRVKDELILEGDTDSDD